MCPEQENDSICHLKKLASSADVFGKIIPSFCPAHNRFQEYKFAPDFSFMTDTTRVRMKPLLQTTFHQSFVGYCSLFRSCRLHESASEADNANVKPSRLAKARVL